MRIIHLIDQRALEAGPGHLAMMLDMIGQLRPFDHHLVALDGKPVARALGECGATKVTVVNCPGSLVSRNLGQMFGIPGEDTVFHAWSATAPATAGRLTEKSSVICSVGHWPLSPTLVDTLGRCARIAKRFCVVQHDPTVSRFLHVPQQGLNLARLAPGLSRRPIDPQQRQALRRAWGVQEGDILVLALDSDGPTDAMANLWVAGLAGETGRPVRLVISPRAKDLSRARRLARSMGRTDRLIVDPRAAMPWEVGPACEVGLVIAGTAGSGGATFNPPPMRKRCRTGSLAQLWAMRAGLGLLIEDAPRTLAQAAAPPDAPADHPLTDPPDRFDPPIARFARSSPRDAARRLIELIDQPDRRAQLARDAERWIDHRFSADSFARDYQSLYRGEPCQSPVEDYHRQ